MIKRIISFASLTTIIFCLCACGTQTANVTSSSFSPVNNDPATQNEPEPIGVSTLKMTSSYRYEENPYGEWINIPQIHLDSSIISDYPQLDAQLTDYNEDVFDNMLEHYAKASQSIMRSDEVMVSVVTFFDEMQGESDNPSMMTENIDSKTGESLDIEDVFDIDSLGLSEDVMWCADYEGVNFYDAGELIHKSYDELNGIIDPKYVNTPTAWGISVPRGKPVSIDIDGDGKLNEITFDAVVEDPAYGSYEGIYVAIDDDIYSSDDYCYDFCGYLLKSSNEKFYLYMEYQMDNDYRGYQIFDFNKKAFVDSDLAGLSHILNNPEYFHLYSHLDLLSTRQVIREYYIGKDGKVTPYTEESYFDNRADVDNDLTLLQDIELPLVDMENGNLTDKTMSLKTGDNLYFYKTNSKDYVDMTTKNGECVRVEIERNWDKDSDYGQLVNNIPIEKLFKDIIFAG